MSEPALISVIVPVYNVERYLTKCVTGIMDQTYQKLEILLIDDGSTDHSGAICDAFAQQDARIRVIHKHNGGLSEARNTGIAASCGEYISFVDGDDTIASGMIEVLYRALKQANAEISICQYCTLDEQGQIICEMSMGDIVSYGTITRVQALRKIVGNKSGYFIVAWNKLYKRRLFDQVEYPVGRVNEDEFIVHRLYSQCNRIACINDVLYFYLQRADGIMGRIKQNTTIHYYLDQFDYMFDRMICLETNNLETDAAEAYRLSADLYVKVCEYPGHDTETTRIAADKKALRKYYGLSKHLNGKTRMRLLLICIHPGLLKKYSRLRKDSKLVNITRKAKTSISRK